MAEPIPVVADRIDKPRLSILVNEKLTELYGWTVEKLAETVPDEDYDRIWPSGTQQYFKELWAYKKGGVGGRHKMDHLINAIKIDLPNFEFTKMGYINSAALRVLRACCDQDDLAIAGAASTGKTYPVAAYVYEDWKSAPNQTLSFVCTTTMGASEDRIWGAIVKLHQAAKHKIGTYVAHKYVIAFGNFSESAADRDFNSAIKALAIPRGEEGKKAVDTTRGRKQLYVRLVLDELPEMDLYVTDAAVNLESNPHLQVIGIGNPASHLDAHGQMCKPDHPLGWKSISKDVPEWKTRTGWCIFLNGEWSPNFEAPEGVIPFPRLTNRKTLAKMLKRCHGNANSIEYYRNAIGFWPDAATIQTVLTEDIIINYKCNRKCLWSPKKRTRLCGFDTGFTAGGDKCVAQFGELGEDDKGKMVLSWIDERIYFAPAEGNFEDTIAKQVVDDCVRFGVTPECFGMDISSDGGKMMRAIIRYWLEVKKDKTAANVVAISSMGKPSERVVSNVDPRKCVDAFDRKVTEFWMMVREGVLCDAFRNFPLYTDEEESELHAVTKQLCSRVYAIKAKKFCIETKEEMKERTQGESPDNADSFVYLVDMGRRFGLTFSTDDDRRRRRESIQEQRRSVTKPEDSYGSDDWGERDEFEDAA